MSQDDNVIVYYAIDAQTGFSRGTDGSVGIDLYSPSMYEIGPHGSVVIDTHVAVEIPKGYEGQVRGRSSLNALNVIVPLGTIDQDYRGSIKVIVHNNTNSTYLIYDQDRIAQLVISPVAFAILHKVQELSDPKTRSGGLGSTGR